MVIYTGIISKGGTRPNIIPDETEMEYYVRTPKRNELVGLIDRMNKCFKAASQATGCTVSKLIRVSIYNKFYLKSLYRTHSLISLNCHVMFILINTGRYRMGSSTIRKHDQ